MSLGREWATRTSILRGACWSTLAGRHHCHTHHNTDDPPQKMPSAKGWRLSQPTVWFYLREVSRRREKCREGVGAGTERERTCENAPSGDGKAPPRADGGGCRHVTVSLKTRCDASTPCC